MIACLFPGFSIKAPSSNIPPPEAIQPLPPPVLRDEDPAIDIARQRAKDEERARKGRRASILTAPEDEQDLGSVRRPGASSSNLG